jgi:hypothetical protein
MEHSNQDDRRRHTRVDFSTKILLKARDVEIETTGSTRDLSMKGVYVSTDRQVPLGTECQVTVLLSGGIETLTLSMKARVARVEAGGIGLSFDSMDLESYTHLKNILMYNADTDHGRG